MTGNFKIITIMDYRPADYETFEPEQGDLVDRDGYISLEQQIAAAMVAGERLENSRRDMFPDLGVGALPVPIFLDKLYGAEIMKNLGQKMRKANAEIQEEAERRAAEAEEKRINDLVEARLKERQEATTAAPAETPKP